MFLKYYEFVGIMLEKLQIGFHYETVLLYKPIDQINTGIKTFFPKIAL